MRRRLAYGAIIIAAAVFSAAAPNIGRSENPPDTRPGVVNEQRARTNYILNCQGCHLSNGEGFGEKVPAMAGEAAKFLSVPGGREYLLRVPGMANAAISDADLAELANWVLYEFDPSHLPHDFTPFTAEEVTLNRAHPLTNEAFLVRKKLIDLIESRQNPNGEQ